METVLLSVGKGIFTTRSINILFTNYKANVHMNSVNTNHSGKQKMVFLCSNKVMYDLSLQKIIKNKKTLKLCCCQ